MFVKALKSCSEPFNVGRVFKVLNKASVKTKTEAVSLIRDVIVPQHPVLSLPFVALQVDSMIFRNAGWNDLETFIELESVSAFEAASVVILESPDPIFKKTLFKILACFNDAFPNIKLFNSLYTFLANLGQDRI